MELPYDQIIHIKKIEKIITAIQSDDIKSLNNILESNIDTIFTHNNQKHTPLTLAVTQSTTTLQFLIDKKANINPPVQPPVIIATKNNKLDNLSLLIKHGSDLNICDEKSLRTPLHYAVIQSNYTMVCLLLQSKINVNAQDCYLKTPLHYASTKPIIQYLIQHGANIDSIDLKYQTPLHIAVSSDSFERTQTLIFSGARPNIRDHNNETPKDIAIFRQQQNIIDLFDTKIIICESCGHANKI